MSISVALNEEMKWKNNIRLSPLCFVDSNQWLPSAASNKLDDNLCFQPIDELFDEYVTEAS